MFIYIYIYIYIHTQTHTHTHRKSSVASSCLRLVIFGLYVFVVDICCMCLFVIVVAWFVDLFDVCVYIDCMLFEVLHREQAVGARDHHDEGVHLGLQGKVLQNVRTSNRNMAKCNGSVAPMRKPRLSRCTSASRAHLLCVSAVWRLICRRATKRCFLRGEKNHP